jgi:DNA-binding transcriptional MerR regulator
MEAGWRSRDGCIDSVTFHCHYSAMPDDDRYSLTELADLAGVTPRTVRYYLAQGLLPAVGQTGPGSKYGEAHLARLRLIRRLQAEHLPLAEIRRRLEGLSGSDIVALAAEPAPAPPADSALDYLRTVLGEGRTAARSVAPPLAASMAPPPGMPLLRHSLQASEAPIGVPPAVAPSGSPSPAEADPSERVLDRSQWERITLSPDIELHVRRPLTRAHQKGVDRLVAIARELLEEDRS